MIYHMLVICWNVIFRFLPDFAGFSDVKSGKNFLFVLIATRRIFPENFSTIWQLILWKLQLSGFFRIFPEKPDHRSGFFWTENHPMPKTEPTKKSSAKSVQAFLNESTNHFMASYDHHQGLQSYTSTLYEWGLVDELRNSKIFPMEAVEDRKKGVCQKSCVLALCITCNWEKNFI